MKIVSPSRLANLLLCALLVGCDAWVYKVDLQQGNIIEAAAVEKLKVGMDKRQVQFLLGSPAVTDVFHADRWDYVYYLKPGRGATRLESVSIYFEGDRIARLEHRPPRNEPTDG